MTRLLSFFLKISKTLIAIAAIGIFAIFFAKLIAATGASIAATTFVLF